MVGLIISLVWFCLSFVFGYSLPEAFLNATSFLFWWYTIITCLLFALCLVGIIFFGAIAFGQSHGIIRIPAGIAFGAVMGIILLVVALSKNFLLIFGAYLLYTSVVISSSEPPVWDQTKLIFGSILLLIGVIATRWKIEKT